MKCVPCHTIFQLPSPVMYNIWTCKGLLSLHLTKPRKSWCSLGKIVVTDYTDILHAVQIAVGHYCWKMYCMQTLRAHCFFIKVTSLQYTAAAVAAFESLESFSLENTFSNPKTQPFSAGKTSTKTKRRTMSALSWRVRILLHLIFFSGSSVRFPHRK